MISKVVAVMKVLFTPVALAYLLYLAWQSKDNLAHLIQNASFLHLTATVATWSLLHALSPLFARVVLNACGSSLSWRRAFVTHAARLPARYLPGGIWHTVGRVMDYREQGVDARHLSVFVILENGFAAMTTLTLGGAIVWLTFGTQSIAYLAGLTSLAGLIAVPVVFWGLNARVLKDPDCLAVGAYAKGLLITVAFWLGAATAFLFYLNAFPLPGAAFNAIEIAGIYLFSWGVGFIAIFAPQGIGIFEVVASELMKGPVGLMGLAALIAGFRVLVLIADLLVWTIYLVVFRKE